MNKDNAAALLDELLDRQGRIVREMNQELLACLQDEVCFLVTESVVLSLEDSIESLLVDMAADGLTGRQVCIADPQRGLFAIAWYDLAERAHEDMDELFRQAVSLKERGDISRETIEHLHRQVVEKDFVLLKDVLVEQAVEVLGRIGTL